MRSNEFHGNYTKHYYNGSERICSRLGDRTFSLSGNVAFSPQTQQRLATRIMQVDQNFRAELLELVEAGDVPVEFPNVLNLITLLPAGSNANSHSHSNPNTDIFYYHTNHLGSTAFVTDNNATITQGFLYASFGEITTEYNANFGNNVLPKYSFNAKELDEETGMYYYEARYYKPPVFTSRDAMMDKKPWFSPYHYCSNNPVGRVDPSGMFDDWVEKADGTIYWDENATSRETTKSGENYLGKEGYGIDEKSGYRIHYKSDGTKNSYAITLKGVTVKGDGEVYQTDNRSISNNNKSGYYWNEKDLKVWESIKNSNSPIGRYVNAQVKMGNFEILSAENYWDTYGYTLGHLKMVQEFITMASLFTPGVNSVPTIKFGGFRGGANPVKTVSEISAPTFNEFRSANKGQFAGYKGRGTNTAEAWKAYKAIYGNKAVFK